MLERVRAARPRRAERLELQTPRMRFFASSHSYVCLRFRAVSGYEDMADYRGMPKRARSRKRCGTSAALVSAFLKGFCTVQFHWYTVVFVLSGSL